VALTHKFSPTLTLSWWGQYYHQVYGEVSGINRVTQALIDNRTYIAGASTYNGANNTFVIANPHLVTIKAYDSFVGKQDLAHATRWQSQFILDKTFSATTFLKNLTYLESRKSDKYEPSIIYSEYVPLDYNIQNRTEFHTSFDAGSTTNSIITGVDFKWERLTSYQSFFGEQYNLTDLTQPSATWSTPVTNIYVFGVPGNVKYGTDVGYGNYGGNQDSKINTTAVFYQHDIKITPKLSFIGGIRLDHIHAADQSPEFIDLGGYGGNGTYYKPGSVFDVAGTVDDWSYFASSLYKLTDTSSAYVTYNRVNAVLGSANFAGIATPDNTQAGLETALKSLATLFEVGYKVVLLDNKFYNTIAWFRQVRTDPDKFGHLLGRIASGVEYETVYQANKNFSILGNFTYQDVFRNGGTSVFQLNENYYMLQPNGSYVSAGAGNTPVAYERRYSGTPNWLTSARLNYRLDSGFNFGIGPEFTGKQKANSEGTITIPTQYKLNAVVGYSVKDWDFQINVDNITNRHNWTVGDPDFTGNTIIYQEKPLTVGFTTRHRF
jgi:outer membrane receptor protein involved in Fe transport